MNVMLIKDTIGKSNSNITLWVKVIIINLWIFEMLTVKKNPIGSHKSEFSSLNLSPLSYYFGYNQTQNTDYQKPFDLWPKRSHWWDGR